jgi:hypothetical protein
MISSCQHTLRVGRLFWVDNDRLEDTEVVLWDRRNAPWGAQPRAEQVDIPGRKFRIAKRPIGILEL